MPRDPFDRYYTPEWAAKAVVERLWRRGYLRDNEDPRRSLVWEPHCGVGRFVDALTTGHPALVPAQVVGTDLYPAREAPPHVSVRRKPHDALEGPPGLFQPTLVLGNPPYREAEEHVRSFLTLPCRPVVAMLLRLAFLESRKRRAFWSEHPVSELHVLSCRPSFTGGGTDTAAYALFIWRHGPDPQFTRSSADERTSLTDWIMDEPPSG